MYVCARMDLCVGRREALVPWLFGPNQVAVDHHFEVTFNEYTHTYTYTYTQTFKNDYEWTIESKHERAWDYMCQWVSFGVHMWLNYINTGACECTFWSLIECTHHTHMHRLDRVDSLCLLPVTPMSLTSFTQILPSKACSNLLFSRWDLRAYPHPPLQQQMQIREVNWWLYNEHRCIDASYIEQRTKCAAVHWILRATNARTHKHVRTSIGCGCQSIQVLGQMVRCLETTLQPHIRAVCASWFHAEFIRGQYEGAAKFKYDV